MKKIIILIFVTLAIMQDVGINWSDAAKATFYQTERIQPEQALYYQTAEKYNDNLFQRVFGGQRRYFSASYSVQNDGPMFSVNIPIK